MKGVTVVIAVFLSILVPTFAQVVCGGYPSIDRYRVTVQGHPEFYIQTLTESQTVEDFYGYGTSSTYKSSSEIALDNMSVIAVHKEIPANRYSLVLLHGPWLDSGGNYVQDSILLRMNITNIPLGFDVAVMDDDHDLHGFDFPGGSLWVRWSWKNINSDGIAIRMPDKSFCVDMNVTLSTRPNEFSFATGANESALYDSTDTISNAVGASINICYDPFCLTPTPTPTATPTLTPTPTSTPTPSPTPTLAPGQCAPGLTIADRWRISRSGTTITYISALQTTSSVEDFYDYSKGYLVYAAATEIVIENVTTIAVHHDTSLDEYSILLVNGPPLSVPTGYVHMEVEVSKLPITASIAVMDDPITDKFSINPDNGTAIANWHWKQPFTDGVAFRLPNKDFCLNINVLKNTYPSRWNFNSAFSTISGVFVSNAEGLDLEVCYEAICATPVPTPCSTLAARWRIEGVGETTTYIEPYNTVNNARTFYGRRHNLVASVDDVIDADNSTLIMVHHDTVKDAWNLMIYIGIPLLPDGSRKTKGKTEYEMTMSNVPVDAGFVIKDDVAYDTMIKVSAAEMYFHWRRFGVKTDGVMINMKRADFCVTLRIIKNTYPNFFHFASGQTLQNVPVKMSNEIGKDILICYDPYCA